MKAHTPTTKGLTKVIDSTISSFITTFRGLPRRLRGTRKSMSTFGSNAVGYTKEHPMRVIASLLLVGVVARRLAHRA